MQSQLPARFLVKGSRRNASGDLEDLYLLVNIQRVVSCSQREILSLKVIQNSLRQLQGSIWHQAQLEWGPFQETLISPDGSIEKVSTILRVNEYLQTPSGIRYFVFTMSYMMDLLPPWSRVYRGWDTTTDWAFRKTDILAVPLPSAPPAPAPARPVPPAPQPISRIPKHILKVFIEAAIIKGDICPITLDPLTQTNAACLPCGHLGDREALQRTMQERKCCPVCRAPGRVEDLQSLN